MSRTTSRKGDDTPILEVSDLSVDFWVGGQWVTAVGGLDYRVNPGEVLAIVGESGSGKSVSSMSILGLLPKNSRTRGSALLNGTELIGAPASTLRRARGNDIAVIFQEPMTALNPVFTVGAQIVEALRVHDHSLTPRVARERALELLDLVDLPDPLKAFNSFPHQLSGGQRQRAMIAQSLSCDPDMLIADEPTTALDVTVQAEILDLLRSLHRRLNSAIVIITHDMGVVADLADNVIVMRKGRVVERGTVRQIFNDPQHEYTQLLLSSVPRLGAVSDDIVAAAEESATATPDEQVAEEREAAGIASVEADREAAEADAAGRVPALRLEHVDLEYPKRGRVPAFKAVSDASFSIYPGEIVGIVGESGSGKTTIARAAVGLLPVASGSMTLAGTELRGASRQTLLGLRGDIGIVFQDPGSSLNPRWPVGQSIAEPLVLTKRFSKAEISSRVEELLDQVELPRSFRNRYPNELSGGQRQRIGIARALALEPKLLVADEPTSALDVSVQKRVLELLVEIQQRLQFAVMFVTHDLAVVDLLAHRTVVMEHGRIVEYGETDQILRAPAEPYTQRLVMAVPVPDPDEQEQRRATRAEVLRVASAGDGSD
ncbi:ABC transporter ATP-binding protein [Pseudoclavibacter chungangensis]|uniref:ABC transporter ATP-binding protein n=1 Tax=Pseudoclavibacter chungangensis TaxID=587635 RepID=A0A7J5BN33_9MICO|nr:ABC transporter ATP-binding protein [Pseudoclavibacter chungangensis]KAB1652500.1 ABC transporter ATP-binding protein [Pseudoclavibacter chungangensis]NYJ66090.1 peptide/nickel transport system ATP-binding protein [Pseudoclavibacter chungangensis]